jgi:hypothetical protein
MHRLYFAKKCDARDVARRYAVSTKFRSTLCSQRSRTLARSLGQNVFTYENGLLQKESARSPSKFGNSLPKSQERGLIQHLRGTARVKGAGFAPNAMANATEPIARHHLFSDIQARVPETPKIAKARDR